MTRRLALALTALVLFAGFVALGSWQLVRLQWKSALIERVNARVHAAPVAPPAEADGHEYLRVRVTGRFLHRLAVPVQAVTVLGPGYWVLTPLERADGSIILVNRGYVAKFVAEPVERSAPVEVTGLLRLSEPGGAFLRNNDPQHGRWYSRDVAAIAKARDLQRVAPYFIDAEAWPQGAANWPVGGLTVIAFHNNHLVYALTWYALAAMVAGACLFLRRGLFERGSRH